MNNTIKQDVEAQFKFQFGSKPLMVFSPGRINIIGEHTDYNNGFVFPAAIDKGVYLAIDTTENSVCTVRAMDKKETFKFDLGDLKLDDSSSSWKNYILGVIAETQKIAKINTNFNLVFKGDLPIGAGLSSSAALENAVVFGLNELFKLGLSKRDMIYISQNAEHNYVGVKCGIMDQYASMFGQEDSALLLDCKSLEANPHKIDFGEYSLLLINTNVSHNLSDSEYNKRRATCEYISNAFNKDSLRDISISELKTKKQQFSNTDYEKALYVLEENKRVFEAAEAIKNKNLKQLGELLFQSHKGLSAQYKVSCNELDFLVDYAQKSDVVLGARMMGGGFGGCTINLIHSSAIDLFKKNIAMAYQNAFNINCDFYDIKLSKGTHLI